MNFSTCLFSYDFPHRKSSEFLSRLIVERLEVAGVIAAPWVDLGARPKARLRIKPKRGPTVDVRTICQRFEIPYVVAAHNSEQAIEAASSFGATAGLIGGARILKGPILSVFERGIVNIHPGLIPEARGLDSLKWSIHEGIPPGVTAHIIDPRVDAGRIVRRETVPIYRSDTLIDVALRVDDAQLEVMPEAMRALVEADSASFQLIGDVGSTYGSMSSDQEKVVEEKFEEWKAGLVAK